MEINLIREVLEGYEYDACGTSHEQEKKRHTVQELANLGKKIAKEKRPIQCVEALYIALEMTQLVKIVRFGISFTSQDNETLKIHRHLVLGIQSNSRGGTEKFGSLGVSRSPNLQSKPLVYNSLYELIQDYVVSYKNEGHTVTLVTFSEFIPRLPSHVIHWNHYCVSIDKNKPKQVMRKINSYPTTSVLLKTAFRRSQSLNTDSRLVKSLDSNRRKPIKGEKLNGVAFRRSQSERQHRPTTKPHTTNIVKTDVKKPQKKTQVITNAQRNRWRQTEIILGIVL